MLSTSLYASLVQSELILYAAYHVKTTSCCCTGLAFSGPRVEPAVSAPWMPGQCVDCPVGTTSNGTTCGECAQSTPRHNGYQAHMLVVIIAKTVGLWQPAMMRHSEVVTNQQVSSQQCQAGTVDDLRGSFVTRKLCRLTATP